jgi:hypothetical protein
MSKGSIEECLAANIKIERCPLAKLPMCDGTSVETTATALALAEQYGCLKLEARCVELITANLMQSV